MSVNAVTMKYTVTDAAINVQLFGKPRHAAPLRTQLFLYDVPDVDGFCHVVCGFRGCCSLAHGSSPGHIKNVDILCPHSEALRKPVFTDKSVHALRRHSRLVRANTNLKFLRFQNVTEQIANAMIYYYLSYYLFTFLLISK